MMANARMHWAVKAKHNAAWKKNVGLRILVNKPSIPFKQANMVCIRYSSTEPDFDGLVMSFKPVIDAFVSYGFLRDDKPSNLNVTYRWEKCAPKRGCIRVIFMGLE